MDWCTLLFVGLTIFVLIKLIEIEHRLTVIENNTEAIIEQLEKKSKN